MTVREYFATQPNASEKIMEYIFINVTSEEKLDNNNIRIDLLLNHTIKNIDFTTVKPIVYCSAPTQKVYTPTLQLGQVVELAKPRIGVLIPSLEVSYNLSIMTETGLVIDCKMYDNDLKHITHGIQDIMKIWDYDTSEGLSLKQIIEQKPSWKRK